MTRAGMPVMRAFTLVELLVALALGTGLVATALTLYARGRAALQTAEAVAQLGEQARYAFATLETDLQMAGYYGLTAAGGDFRFLQGGNVTTAAPASALRQGAAALAGLNTAAQACGLQFALDLAVPVQAANNHYAAGAGATAACNPRPAAASTSDTLTIRRAAGTLAAPQAGRLQLLAERSDRARRFVLADGTLPPGTTLAADHLELHELVTRFYYVAGADATAACNARPAAASTSDTLTIRRAAGTVAAPQAGRLQLLADRSDRARRFVLADGTLPPGTTLAADHLELHDLVTRFYYVATDSDGAPGVPALRVKTLSSVGGRPAFIDTEVMSGIEDLQVEFRIDGGYVAPDVLPAAAVVRGLRVWLRVRAAGPEADHVDTRTWRYADVSYTPAAGERAVRRQVIAHLVALRNAPGL